MVKLRSAGSHDFLMVQPGPPEPNMSRSSVDPVRHCGCCEKDSIRASSRTARC